MSQTTDWTAPTYRDANGVHHTVVCDRLAAGTWRVLDVTDTEILLVDRLGAYDDGQPQAQQLADDYVEQMRRYIDGGRDELPVTHPLPHAVKLRLTAAPAAVKAVRSKPRPRKRAAAPAAAQDQLPLAA